MQQDIWIVVGTRPEVIKQIPVYWSCIKRWGQERVALVATGQHRELVQQALDVFGVHPDVDLNLMQPGQSLNSLAAAVLQRLDGLLEQHHPKWVVVQGDTTTAAAAGFAAYQRQILVAHNEAGLRSFDLQNPFPEEANRKWIASYADLHFAPTEQAAHNLLAEGVAAPKIIRTGNSGIDALFWALRQPMPVRVAGWKKLAEQDKLKIVLVTAHRRENRGHAMEQWFSALKSFLQKHPEVLLICPLHPNQAAGEAARTALGKVERAQLTEPLNYLETCHLQSLCSLVVTDSGGVQEESATLGVPAVVCRKTTERPEGVVAGLSRLANPEEVQQVLDAMEWALHSARRSAPTEIYGNGQAGERIAEWLK